MSDTTPTQYETAGGKTRLQGELSDQKTSALKKYLSINVGSDSLFDLFKYEIYMMLIAPMPGALGYLLRKFYLKFLLGACGGGVIIGRSVTFRHPAKIRLGDGVMIDDYAILDAKGERNNGITLGDYALLGRYSVLSCKDGDITVGDNTNIAMNCMVQSGKNVEIGSKVLFGAFCYVIGGGDHITTRTDIPIMDQGQTISGITIGDNTWLGAGVKVVDGVHVGRDVIVGASAVVNKDVPDYHVAAGVPARNIRDRREQVEYQAANKVENNNS